MYSTIRFYLIIAVSILLLSGCSKNELKRITIRVHANDVSDSTAIYLTGNSKQFGDWNPGLIKLNRDSANSWSRTFFFKKGDKLEYDFTRGSFSKDSFGPEGILHPFHQFITVINDTTITTIISGWADKTGGYVSISAKDFGSNGDIWILSGWKYHPGDSVNWADTNYNDNNWEVTNTILNPDEHPSKGWNGLGWFRIKINMDSALLQNSFMYNMWQSGASEIYADGKLVDKFGKVGFSTKDETLFDQRVPQPLMLSKSRSHLIAVRYSNHSSKYFNDKGIYAGFKLMLGYTKDRVRENLNEVQNNLINLIIFGAIPFTLAILHFIIFIFYPRYKENLYYSLCMAGFAGIVFSVNSGIFTTNVFQVINISKLGFISENIAIIFGLLTTYYSVYGKTPKHGWLFIGFSIVFVIWVSIYSLRISAVQDIFLAIVILEMLRCILFVKNTSKSRGNFSFGFLILLVLLIYQLLVAYDFINPIFGFTNGYLLGVLVLSFSMSLRLSKKFASTNDRLEEQLLQVKELSEQALENERKVKEQEIEKRLLEADNKRKTIELAEARRLQLSMLPKTIPHSDDWQIDVFMRTASEVGGDYYDFHTDVNGTLTIAIGDATGHGVNAGTMVAVTKSLFSEFAENENIVETFNKYNSFIKSMNLGNLYMALTIAKIKKGKMILSSAGMPPVLVYRAESRTVDEIRLKGMPLGGFLNYPYQQAEIELGLNDIVLFMTDGLPEMFNKIDEIFGYEKTKEEFKEILNKSYVTNASIYGKDIIEKLLNRAEAWANGRMQEDDITFVVLKNLYNKITIEI
jgi:serine phosphatase RsbU (regulator of sigma subunit)